MLCTVINRFKSISSPCWLPILVAAEISGHRVMLNGLMQHKSEQTSSVGHRCPDIALLFKEFIQFVPLWREEKAGEFCQQAFALSRHHFKPQIFIIWLTHILHNDGIQTNPVKIFDSPPWRVPSLLLPSGVFPSCNVCCISFWRPCSILPSAQRHS